MGNLHVKHHQMEIKMVWKGKNVIFNTQQQKTQWCIGKGRY